MQPQSNSQNSFPPHLKIAINLEDTLKKNVTRSVASPNTFAHPVITKEAHKATLDNYRKYVAAYNDQLKAINKDIRHYNKNVEKFIEKNPVTENKILLLKLFTSKYHHYKNNAYNKEVENFNDTHGLYIKKLPFQTVKPLSLQVFEAFLHGFTVQLQAQVKIFRQIGKTTPTTLPKMSINPYEISCQQRKGTLNLDLCGKTIRNHRERLEQAGVLIEKEYRGTSRPVKFAINPKILVVFEGYTPKTQNAENQFINSDERNVLPHTKVDTRSFKDKLEIKGNVNKHSRDKENSSNLLSNLKYYKVTQTQEGEKNSPAQNFNTKPGEKIPIHPKAVDAFRAKKANRAAKIETSGALISKIGVSAAAVPAENTVHDQLTEKWLNQIDNRFDLAGKLSQGVYNYYTPIATEDLRKMERSPGIDSEDFREIVIQDFIRSAAQLNRYDQAGAGSWGLAIKHIDKQFGCLRFTGKVTSKSDCYSKLMEFRYRLRRAVSWFNKRNWKAVRYASDYFDPLNDLPCDVAWKYTEKFWTKELKRQQDNSAARKKKAFQAAAKKEALIQDKKENEKLDRAIRKYFNKTYSLEQLTEYVTKQLPKKQQDQLPSRMNELNLKNLIK
ncbi:hypothetical protein [Cochleicola gelatinilyticus]|uniref:Uncharacterized protein n=1 Tax=Cochleicola gelatinilyticus TaxID=1763537 RepID=A0A167IK03_9FLAO|nr:hypothetical protein [Cochleicola gelatinilyticus]OAB79733.1 hypothetical protein ULVI_03030 [Cochleicola gelatinilyticus]